MTQATQMIKHSSIYAFGTISRQLVGFIMLPIYTTYLTPADYGVIGLLVFLVSLFEILLGGHMFQAVPKFYHQEDDVKRKNAVVSTAFIVTAAFSGIACLLMAVFAVPLSAMTFGDEKYSIYIIIFSALILTHALEMYSLTYLRILKKPWTFFNFNMAKLAIQLSLNIYTIVVLDMGLMGLALSSLISSLAISIILTIYTLSKTGIELNRKFAVTLIKFSWPLWLSGLLGLYIGSSNKYFIRIFSSLDDVGLFELASKFAFIVMVLIWSPFSQYWQTERFAIAKTDNPYPAFSLAFRMITALLLISGLTVSIFSRTLIEFMSDLAFHAAADAVPFLVIACIFQSLTFFINFSFMYMNETYWITKTNIFTALSITVLYIILIPTYGFIGASIAAAFGYIAQYFYALNKSQKIYPLHLSQNPLIIGIILISLFTAIDYHLTDQARILSNIAIKSIITLFTSILIMFLTFDRNELTASKKTILNLIQRKTRN